MWWLRGQDLPPLVTAAPPRSKPITADTATPGTIGSRHTRVLFGGDYYDEQQRYGGRISGGWWVDPCQTFAFEAYFLGLSSAHTDFQASTATGRDVFLARPFFDAIDLGRTALLVTGPFLVPIAGADALLVPVAGGVGVLTSSQFYSGGVVGRKWICGDASNRLDLIGGYRYLNLRERLTINQGSELTADLPQEVGAPIPAGTRTTRSDLFKTSTQFHGEDLGLRWTYTGDPLTIEVQAKLACGFNLYRATVRGETTYLQPGDREFVTDAGLLALRSNSGGYKDSDFAIAPEVAINFGYNLGRHLRLSAGYTFLYWTQVLRPGDQINPALNPFIIPPTPINTALNPNLPFPTPADVKPQGRTAPGFEFRPTDLWVHGVNFGVEVRY
jgi:hypothetical protein